MLRLSKACQQGDLTKVKLLVREGVDIDAQDGDALRWACCHGYFEVVEFLVEHGANIHVMDECPFLMASENGYLNIVKLLYEKGANIHANNDYALRKARLNNKDEVATFLKKKILKEKLLAMTLEDSL